VVWSIFCHKTGNDIIHVAKEVICIELRMCKTFKMSWVFFAQFYFLGGGLPLDEFYIDEDEDCRKKEKSKYVTSFSYQ